MFNIIARKTLLNFCKKYPEAATALQQWYYELLKFDFKNFNEVKKVYGSVSLVGDDRVAFNNSLPGRGNPGGHKKPGGNQSPG